MATYVPLYNFTDQGIAQSKSGIECRLSAMRRGQPGQILISSRVLTKVEDAVTVEPVGEFALKRIRRPLAACNVIVALASKV